MGDEQLRNEGDPVDNLIHQLAYRLRKQAEKSDSPDALRAEVQSLTYELQLFRQEVRRYFDQIQSALNLPPIELTQEAPLVSEVGFAKDSASIAYVPQQVPFGSPGGFPKGSPQALLAALGSPSNCTADDVNVLLQTIAHGKRSLRFEGTFDSTGK